jgi:peptidoglycan/xylan/chitin deacetylase (PgdA/CDA1 family)
MGAHSDKHLLYADWTTRDSLLVTERQFKKDLLKNYERMRRFGIEKRDAVYFLPPYEWYNKSIVSWTRDLGLVLVNFSPGTSSTADYTFPATKNYKSSEQIYNSIIDYEKKNFNGLNGFILLIHIGADDRRTDKFYLNLDTLLNELISKGYTFVRIDELLN